MFILCDLGEFSAIFRQESFSAFAVISRMFVFHRQPAIMMSFPFDKNTFQTIEFKGHVTCPYMEAGSDKIIVCGSLQLNIANRVEAMKSKYQ